MPLILRLRVPQPKPHLLSDTAQFHGIIRKFFFISFYFFFGFLFYLPKSTTKTSNVFTTVLFFVDGHLTGRLGVRVGFVSQQRWTYYEMVQSVLNWGKSRSEENITRFEHCGRLSMNPNTASAHECSHWFVWVCFCGLPFKLLDTLQKHKLGAVDSR